MTIYTESGYGRTMQWHDYNSLFEYHRNHATFNQVHGFGNHTFTTGVTGFTTLHTHSTVSGFTSYLGRVEVQAHSINSSGYALQVQFDPTGSGVISHNIEFSEYAHWEPCVELDHPSNVVFKARHKGNSEGSLHIDFSILEK